MHERWNLLAIGILATFLGVGYTALSEWLNTAVWSGWQYASAMPVVNIGEIRIGFSPLAQWLIVPPLALYVATRVSRAERQSGAPRVFRASFRALHAPTPQPT